MLITHLTKRSVSVNNTQYDADDDCVIDLPDEYAVHLLHHFHGFVIAENVGVHIDPPKKRGRPRKVLSDDELHDAC